MERKQQSVVDATMDIINAALSEKTSITSNKRTLRALKTLGLHDAELLRVGRVLDMWDSEGRPWIAGSPTSQD